MRASTITAAGLDWHVRESGPADGAPVLLLHGFPETGRCWSDVAPRLAAAGHRVLVPDLPGYGDSTALPAPPALDALAGLVVALADALHLPRFTLVGHDWGGLIAWGVAARHPDRLSRLVAVDAPHPDAFADFTRRHASQMRRSAYVGVFQLPRLPEAMLRARNFALLRRGFPCPPYDAADLDAYVQAWRRPGRLTAMIDYYRGMRRPRAPLGRIEVPTLILWGARDPFLDPRLAEASRAACTRAAAWVHPTSGHWLPREAPDWLTDRLLAMEPA